MEISVVIPSYNTDQTIEKTLTKLEAQKTELNYEIIVVDCSSHERVTEKCTPFKHTSCIKVAKRFNPGEGRNIGAKAAKGSLLIFVDSDVQIANDVLEKAWDHYQAGAKIFGGALELNLQEDSSSAAYLEHFFFNHESQASRPECERSNLSSAFMCFERSLFIGSGGFKDIPRMQDTELTERLKRDNQVKLMFYPDMTALQTQDSPLSKVLRKIFINGQNVYYIRYKKNVSAVARTVLFLTLPLIGAAKTLRIIARHLKYQPIYHKLKTVVISPLLILGGAVWTAGFYNALITQKGMGKSR